MADLKLKAIGIRRRGQWLLAFVRDGGRVVIATPPALWTARKNLEKELGGPVPRPFGRISTLAAMVDAGLARTTEGD